jgi:acyl-CoA reductase-like NAD-dependent aldehyde dehydrogenase
MASSDIVVSFSGCAGQRCKAAAILLTVGDQPKLIEKVCAKAAAMPKGQEGGQVGPVIDKAAQQRILRHINAAEKDGAEVLVDGRKWAEEASGNWVGPTVLRFPAEMKDHPSMKDEIFGPVLCVRTVKDAQEALDVEAADPHGNAACIYTQHGETADWFGRNFSAGMIGVNIGVPVPREPFSFGGLEGSRSKFGEHDITGEGALNFFTKVRKITTRWTAKPNAVPDLASFAGVM